MHESYINSEHGDINKYALYQLMAESEVLSTRLREITNGGKRLLSFIFWFTFFFLATTLGVTMVLVSVIFLENVVLDTKITTAKAEDLIGLLVVGLAFSSIGLAAIVVILKRQRWRKNRLQRAAAILERLEALRSETAAFLYRKVHNK